jgi:hypothetical protein
MLLVRPSWVYSEHLASGAGREGPVQASLIIAIGALFSSNPPPRNPIEKTDDSRGSWQRQE